MTHSKNSNLWNFPSRWFPASGIRSSAFGIRHFALLLLLPLCVPSVPLVPSATAQTVDVARARAWLTARVPAMLADTTTPIRVLATTAQALTDTNLTAQLRTAILARQRSDGFFATPGTADAQFDQTAAELTIAHDHPAAALRSVRALLSRQQPDGGWTASLGTTGRSDAISTAETLIEIVFTSAQSHKSEGGEELAEKSQAALMRGAKFLESLQDETTGLLGYETSSYGAWGATAAGYYVLALASSQNLTTRRAYIALATPDLRSYPARDPLREARRLLLAMRMIPPQAADIYKLGLLSELANKQQPDGHWPVIKPQTNELLATASALILARALTSSKTGTGRPCAALHFSELPGSLGERNSRARILLTLPAETADTLLVDQDEIFNHRIVVLCNQASLMTALQRRFTNPETKNFNTLGWKLADIAKAARAGPITLDRIANHISDEKNIPVKYLLGTDDLTAALDTLTDKQLARAVAELEKIPVRDHLNRARNLWAANSWDIKQEIAALIPPTLKPVLEKLSALAATRIRTELQKNPDTLLILDAFLALGPTGILARLNME